MSATFEQLYANRQAQLASDDYLRHIVDASQFPSELDRLIRKLVKASPLTRQEIQNMLYRDDMMRMDRINKIRQIMVAKYGVPGAVVNQGINAGNQCSFLLRLFQPQNYTCRPLECPAIYGGCCTDGPVQGLKFDAFSGKCPILNAACNFMNGGRFCCTDHFSGYGTCPCNSIGCMAACGVNCPGNY